MGKWEPFDEYPAVEWITAEIVRLTCCGTTQTLYPEGDAELTCPTCGKRYRLIVDAHVEMQLPIHTNLARAGSLA